MPTNPRGQKKLAHPPLAFVVSGICVMRYDSEAGKGDHRHMKGKELKYRFVSVDKLVADFFEDVKKWRDENSDD